MTRTPVRRAVTLIELIVVMAIMTALLALAAALAPSIASSDQTQKGAAELQATCRIAQGYAATTGRPHGVGLIVNAGYFCTELQYLEAPEVLVPDPRVLVAKPTDPTGINGPRVELLYEVYSGAEPSINPVDGTVPARGTIKRRHCYIRNLTPEQRTQVVDRATLVIPAIGVWSRITSTIGAIAGQPDEVILEVYPDVFMGATTNYRTYHFGIYGVPVPMLAEPTVPMPKGIAIDLEPNVSSPALAAPGTNFEIMFAPNGQPIGTRNMATNTNAYFLVRDTSKFAGTLNRAAVPPATLGASFRQAGELQIVGVRAGGFVGVAPAMPSDDAGNYSAQYPDIFALAREQLNR